MPTLNKLLEGIGDIDGMMILIVIDNEGGIQVIGSDQVTALIFGNTRSEKPHLEVRCQLDFITYFAKLAGVPLKFNFLQKNGNIKGGDSVGGTR